MKCFFFVDERNRSCFIVVGFGLEPDYFSRHHQKIGTSENASLLKCLYYYPLKKSDVAKIKDGQLRCSDHTDKGQVDVYHC